MRHLFINNFGPVHKAELDLKSFNLLIGEQSVGKSTIAKLISVLTDNFSLFLIASKGFDGWLIQMRMFNLDIFKDDDYHIIYDYEVDSRFFHFDIKPNNIVSYVKIDGRLFRSKTRIAKEIVDVWHFFHEKEIFEKFSIIKERFETEKNPAGIISFALFMSSSLYIPAERVIFSLFKSLQSAISLAGDIVPITFMRFMVHLEQAKAKKKKYNSSLLDITYVEEEKEMFFIDHKSNKKYSLFEASSGIQSTLPLLLLLDDIPNREYSSIVIEEPETNLFPTTQVDLLKVILNKARVEGRTATVTTHSPYILSALNNYLYAGALNKELSGNATTDINAVIPQEIQLTIENCSVYSIGLTINSSGDYCESLIDKEVGMINSNTLDRVSFKMSEDFDALQDIYIKHSS